MNVSLVCPISISMMQNPVVDPQGHSFESDAINKWLAAQPSPSCCPLRSFSVTQKNRAKHQITLTVNTDLQERIRSYTTIDRQRLVLVEGYSERGSFQLVEEAQRVFYRRDIELAKRLVEQALKAWPANAEAWKTKAALQSDDSEKMETLLQGAQVDFMPLKERKMLCKMVLLKQRDHEDAKRLFIKLALPTGKCHLEKYLGKVGSEPPLTQEIEECLHKACSFEPTMKIYQTHLLQLMTPTLDKESLSLTLLSKKLDPPPEKLENPPEELENPPEELENPPEELENPPEELELPPEKLENPPEELELPPEKLENPTKMRAGIRLIDNYCIIEKRSGRDTSLLGRDIYTPTSFGAATPIKSPYWFLMTKFAIPESRAMSYSDHCTLLKDIVSRTGLAYDFPKPIEAVLATTMHFFRTGERLFVYKGGEEGTGTTILCPEELRYGKSAGTIWPVTVGNFYEVGLSIACNNLNYESGSRFNCIALVLRFPYKG